MIPKLNTLDEVKAFFSDLLGPQSVMKSPDSPRAYVKVGTKDGAVLFANVGIDPCCYHAENPAPDKVHQKALGASVRFFQIGGDPKTFAPTLSVRAVGDGAYRLSKHDFPVLVVESGDMNIRNAWVKQKVSSHLAEWIQSVIVGCGGTPISYEVLVSLADMAISHTPDPDEESADHVFTLTPKQLEAPKEAPAGFAQKVKGEYLN